MILPRRRGKELDTKPPKQQNFCNYKNYHFWSKIMCGATSWWL